jgi:hypothetical protein
MYEVPGFCISVKADAAVATKHVFMKATATGMAAATAITDPILGVVQREGILGEVLPVMTSGVSMVVASDAIAKGAIVAPAADGKAVTATGPYCGIALEAATAAGDIIPVLLVRGGETA